MLVALTSVEEAMSIATTERVFVASGMSETETLQLPLASVEAVAEEAPPVMLIVVLASAVPVRTIGFVVVDCVGVVMTGTDGTKATAGRAARENISMAATVTMVAPFRRVELMFIGVQIRLVIGRVASKL